MTQGIDSQIDARGVPLSACQAQSLDDFESALLQFNSYFGDPVETLTKTLSRDPEFVLGHIFIASALMMMTERRYQPLIRKHLEQADALQGKANQRERLLTEAIRLWLDNEWDRAGLCWDQVLVDHPRDLLALQLGHLCDFFRGDCFNLRDRVCRVMISWDTATPNYSYVVGMQAFGFEECNQYDKAEDAAFTALGLQARDPWAVHALAHVLEMQGRFDEGEVMYRDRQMDWGPDSGFAYHNWWHWALFHLEHEDFDSALQLFDEQILPQDTEVTLQLLDASSLLWRLHLQGIDLGSRWQRIADLWAPKSEGENGFYAFNDMHAVLAFVGSQRFDEANAVLSAVTAAADKTGVTGTMARQVGIAVCQALIDFGQQRYQQAIERLLPIRSIAHRFGGSHAQRDILTQTLTEAALRSGQIKLATNLISERQLHKPFSPFTQRLAAKLSA